jgi:hypothetical protein
MEITSAQEQIKNSKCFGVAYDATVKECKICEVANMCKMQMEKGISQVPNKPSKAAASTVAKASEDVVNPAPAKSSSKPKPAAAKSEKPAKKATNKPGKNYDPDMPDFKQMELDELESTCEERGIDLGQFEKYSSDQIKRMRMVMALKATYEI